MGAVLLAPKMEPIGADAVRAHDRVVRIFVKPQIAATAHIWYLLN
jgi:hypothetical protein